MPPPILFITAALASLASSVALASPPPLSPSPLLPLAPTPPRGWRSWNVFYGQLSQDWAVQVVDALVARVLPVAPLDGPLSNLADLLPGGGGELVSMAELGYNRMAEDDMWQACASGVNGSFHNASGFPIFAKSWPNVRNLTDYAHSLNVSVDWYANNDGCGEYGKVPAYYFQDALVHVTLNGVDGIKFDAGGPGRNMTQWALTLNQTGKAVLVENANNQVPFRPSYMPDGTLDCPYHFYRTSIDNSPSLVSGISNMMDTAPWLNVSQPNCWAYADALEIGSPEVSNAGGNKCTPHRMTFSDAQASFAMWSATSQPLILSFDVRNATEVSTWFPIVSNRIALAINSLWAGSAGALVAQSQGQWQGPVYHGAGCEVHFTRNLPEWTVWAKPLNASAVAVVAVNTLNSTSASFSVPFVTLGLPPTAVTAAATDVWTGEALPAATGSKYTFSLAPSGHVFIVLSLPPAVPCSSDEDCGGGTNGA